MKGLPGEFLSLGLDIGAFKRSDNKSMRGPCPKCGGHRRFVMFMDHDWPLNNGYCDECGLTIKAWQKVKVHVDPERVAAMEAETAREEAEKAERRRVKLADFTSHELWLELSERMERENVEWWASQGIPEEIQHELKLGYTPDKIFKDERGLHHSAAYTFPWFGYGFAFKTMQYRLTNPIDPSDKYRFEKDLPGGGSLYYMTTPGEKIGDKVIICEGAKKAIVTWFWLAMDFTVIAVAGRSTLGPALEATKDCGLRYLVLDPDSQRKAFETARKEKNLKAVYLPGKIDDMYLAEQLDRQSFTDILRVL